MIDHKCNLGSLVSQFGKFDYIFADLDRDIVQPHCRDSLICIELS
jgi:hypothetical protein